MKKFSLLVLSLILALSLTTTNMPVLAYDPQDGFRTVFTPEVNATEIYIEWLENYCHKTLYVADFTFTSAAITNEYCKLADKGVSVHIILDKLESKAVKAEGPLIAQMAAAGIEVIITTSPKKGAIMHLKCSIADGLYVEDGSFNYTEVANNQCNDLNFNIQPSTARADLFKKAWDYIYNYAKSKEE